MISSINAKDVSKVWVQGHLLIQLQILEILVRKQMEQTILVRFGQNIWQHLWRWSTGMTEMTLSIWNNCCPRYCSSVPCLQVPTQTHSGLGLRSVQLECTVPLGVWNFQNFKHEFLLNGTHHKARCGRRFPLLCLGSTRSFNKNILKNVPLHVKALYCVHPKYNVSRAVIKRRGLFLLVIFMSQIEKRNAQLFDSLPTCCSYPATWNLGDSPAYHYIFWILFTVGNVDRDIGRHSGRYSGRQSVDSRSIVGR